MKETEARSFRQRAQKRHSRGKEGSEKRRRESSCKKKAMWMPLMIQRDKETAFKSIIAQLTTNDKRRGPKKDIER